VQRTMIRPPSSRLGPITESERRSLIQSSAVFGIYDRTTDRESAFEILKRRAAEQLDLEEERRAREDEDFARRGAPRRSRSGFQLPDFGRGDRPLPDSRRQRSTRRSNRDSVMDAALKSVVRSVGSSLGRALVRGILGSMKRGS